MRRLQPMQAGLPRGQLHHDGRTAARGGISQLEGIPAQGASAE